MDEPVITPLEMDATTLLYFATVHEPHQDSRDPQPVNCTVVDVRTLLHPRVPQPDGGNLFRCVIEPAGRVAGSVVPLSTVTFELDGGRLWPSVADWEAVSAAVANLARDRGCDAMRLGLPAREANLIAHGPFTTHTLQYPDRTEIVGARERQDVLDWFAIRLAGFAAEAPVWPGDGLVEPPLEPARMPYEPFD